MAQDIDNVTVNLGATCHCRYRLISHTSNCLHTVLNFRPENKNAPSPGRSTVTVKPIPYDKSLLRNSQQSPLMYTDILLHS